MNTKESNPMKYPFILDNFDCSITKTDEGLVIEAEHQKSHQLLYKILTEESIKTISNDLFFDLPTTYQVIQDFFEDRPRTASLSLASNGKLSYNCKLSFGKVTKELEFEIELDQKEREPSANIERLLEKLSSRISKIEEQNSSLDQKALDKKFADYFKNFEKHIFAKLTEIENRLAKVEEKIENPKNKEEKQEESSLSFEFNPVSLFGSYFFFSNNNKTITSTSSSSQKPVFIKPALPKSKTSKLSFLIVNNAQKGIGIGIAPYETLNKSQPFFNSKAYLYYSMGNVWKDGDNMISTYPVPKNGDTITFLINTETGQLKVEINGKVVDTHTLDANHMKSSDYYSFVYATYTTECITIL